MARLVRSGPTSDGPAHGELADLVHAESSEQWATDVSLSVRRDREHGVGVLERRRRWRRTTLASGRTTPISNQVLGFSAQTAMTASARSRKNP